MQSKNNILLLSTVGAILAIIYIIWGPTQRQKRKVPGLENMKNICFLNAVLQALASCSTFIIRLKKVISLRKTDDPYCLHAVLLELLQELNSKQTLCSAFGVLQVLQKKQWIISDEEQDAHELLHVLTTTLEEEETEASPATLSLLDVKELEGDVHSSLYKKAVMLAYNGVSSNPLTSIRGLLVNQLVCRQCGSKYPTKYDAFESISLNIPRHCAGVLKLQDCLMDFIACEFVRDVTCDFCCKKEPCNSYLSSPKVSFIKKQSFGKLPELLCFHIQRTVWTSDGSCMKRYEHISFPEILNMDKFVCKVHAGNYEKSDIFDDLLLDSPKEKQVITKGTHVYLLRAVIVHIGDLLAGHFVTYRRGALNSASEKKWFYTSDCCTKEVSFSEVKQVCAYMLFYEKFHIE